MAPDVYTDIGSHNRIFNHTNTIIITFMNFTVYSKRLCPYCDKVKKILEHLSTTKGFPIVIYELDTEFNREQFISEFGEGSTFPQVIVNDKKLGGCVDTIKYLQENRLL